MNPNNSNPYPQQGMNNSNPNNYNQNPYPQQGINNSNPNNYNQNPYQQPNPYNQQSNYNQNQYQQPNPYNQQNNYNQNPYQKQNYGQNQNNFNPGVMARQLIMNYADNLFSKYDGNGSGFLDVKEIYPAISELYQINNMPPPPYNQVLNIMRTFDTDGNGLLDRNEFRKLLLILNGHQ